MDHLALGRLGTTLNGKWYLDAVLGVGGMGTVYAATHRNGYRVAVKILHPSLSAQDAPRERFLREGYIANKVEHRDTVAVIDEDVDADGNVFLVMELLEGQPLSARRRAAGGRLPAGPVLWIAHRLLRVLEAAHTHGIVHRDIKPENLFVTSDGSLKVLDFGIARFGMTQSGNTLHGIPMGTPGFAAPEQVRGEWDLVDARADLFAVGATMFVLVVGKLVHEQATPYAQMRRMALEPAPRVRDVDPTVPAPLAQVIDRALSFRAQDRFQTAVEMGHAVASAFVSMTGRLLPERFDESHVSIRGTSFADVPTVISPGHRGESSTAPSRKMRAPIAGGAAVAVCVLALGVGSKLRQLHSAPAPETEAASRTITRDVAAGSRVFEMSESVAVSAATHAPEHATVASATAVSPSPPATFSSRRISPSVSVSPAPGRIARPEDEADNGAASLSNEALVPMQQPRPRAADRPTEGPPSRRAARPMDFVETRH